MPSEEATRLTALLTPALGDWLYEPAAQCAAGHENTDYECGPLAPVGEPCPQCVDEAFERQWPWAADASEEQTYARLESRRALARRPDPAWVITRGAPKDLDAPDLFWAAWGRWLAAVGAEAPTMEVYWSGNNHTWAAAWPPKPWGPKHIATGDTPAQALMTAWFAWLQAGIGKEVQRP